MTDYAHIHQPVLLEQCVGLVSPALRTPGALAVDCTLGLAGHSIAFLKAAPQARLIGIDRDIEALRMATARIEQEGLGGRFIPVHAAFDDFSRVLEERGIDTVQAVFMDLGLSSLQIDERERGFSYAHDAPLDMRMDVSQPLTAQMVLERYDAAALTRIFKAYGEERFARQIAQEIVRSRADEPLTSSRQLTALVDRVIPQAHRGSGNPAKRVFQALRIEVNGELEKLAHTAADRQPACGGWQACGGVVPLARRQDGQIVHDAGHPGGCACRYACCSRRHAAVLRAAHQGRGDGRRRGARAQSACRFGASSRRRIGPSGAAALAPAV